MDISVAFRFFLPLEIKVGYINSSVAVFFPHTGFGVKVIKSQERVEFQRTETLDVYTASAAAKSLQSCMTLCDPMDSSPPGSSVHRILQTRILEWVAISFSTII